MPLKTEKPNKLILLLHIFSSDQNLAKCEKKMFRIQNLQKKFAFHLPLTNLEPERNFMQKKNKEQTKMINKT